MAVVESKAEGTCLCYSGAGDLSLYFKGFFIMKNKNEKNSVRKIVLMGVFWRILIIEGILLIGTLIYTAMTEEKGTIELLWYALRIISLVTIIILFMMITLKNFLTEKIITPLEDIAAANVKLQKDISRAQYVELSDNLPHEIETIITSRSKMLKTILDISEERLKYSTALNDELERGKKIQKDFLPHSLPKVKNCDISSYFHSALQLSGDFYDAFKLPLNHIGFVIGDVSGKGVGAALFMALTRSLIRIFSGSYNIGNNSSTLEYMGKIWTPEKALKAVYLTNEYLAKEHGDDGMFVTLFFGIIDPLTGNLFYINGGHEPLMVINKNGIKHSLKGTGPVLGPIQGATYGIGSIQLEKDDLLFSYTDGVTEAQSETRDFYTRAKLKNIFENGFEGSSVYFLETIKTDLFAFTKNAPQSDDITMLAIKWLGVQK